MDEYARGLERAVWPIGSALLNLDDLDLFGPWLAWVAGCRHDLAVDRSNYTGA